MNRTGRVVFASLVVCGLAAPVFAQPKPDQKPAAKPSAAPAQPKADPMAPTPDQMMQLGKPGKMHEHLAKSVGTWDGKVKAFDMTGSGAPPQESTCTSTNTAMMEGRFIKTEVSGEMGEMGHFEGFGLIGYDTAAQKFQQTWVDNFGTGMMVGTGELSPDGKMMTWRLNYTDPMTKKQGTFREVEHYNDENSMTMEMFGPGPDGKEVKVMEIAFTRKGSAPAAGATSAAGAAGARKAPAAAPKK